MSTAGKVLVCLTLLMALVWIAAVAGVDELNRNGNKRLEELSQQIAKLAEQTTALQKDVIATKDQITLQEETTDREIARLRSQQSDVEKARSETAEILQEVQLEVAMLQETVKNSKVAETQRIADRDAEQKAIAGLKTELEGLKKTNAELIARVGNLRTQFTAAYRAGVELVGRSK